VDYTAQLQGPNVSTQATYTVTAKQN